MTVISLSSYIDSYYWSSYRSANQLLNIKSHLLIKIGKIHILEMIICTGNKLWNINSKLQEPKPMEIRIYQSLANSSHYLGLFLLKILLPVSWDPYENVLKSNCNICSLFCLYLLTSCSVLFSFILDW